MNISDDDKRRIMSELAQGNVDSLPETTASPVGDRDFDPQDYQNFDDFAQRPPGHPQQDTSTQAFFHELQQRHAPHAEPEQ